VVVRFGAWQELAIGVADGFPFLALVEDRRQVAGSFGDFWPCVKAQVGHRLVSTIGGQHCPRCHLDGSAVHDGVLRGLCVGFGDPVAAGLVALAGLCRLKLVQDQLVARPLAMPSEQTLLVVVPLVSANDMPRVRPLDQVPEPGSRARRTMPPASGSRAKPTSACGLGVEQAQVEDRGEQARRLGRQAGEELRRNRGRRGLRSAARSVHHGHLASCWGARVQIPSGIREPGEEAASCARRELMEETGCDIRSLEHLVGFYPSPGVSNEFVDLFLETEFVRVGCPQPEGD
jgi:hypothetical protein